MTLSSKKKVVKDLVDLKEEALRTALKSIQKDYSEVIVTDFDNLPDHEYISTGSLALDNALGGGLVRGRLMEIFGEEQGGKTSLALMIMKNYLENCDGYVLFDDPEFALDKKLLISYGLDTSRIKFIYGSDGKANLNAFLKLIKTGAFGVGVIDSISPLIPPGAEGKEIGDNIVGRHAMLMQDATTKLVPALALTNTLCIYVNQIRSKIVSWGDPTTTTGGNALKFYYSYRLNISGGLTAGSRIKDKSGLVIGHKMKIKIVKNKLAPPHRVAELDLLYGKGFDAVSEILMMAEDLGYVERSGTWYAYEGERLGQGRDNTLDFLRDHSDMYKDIKSKIMDMITSGGYGGKEFEPTSDENESKIAEALSSLSD